MLVHAAIMSDPRVSPRPQGVPSVLISRKRLKVHSEYYLTIFNDLFNHD
jgi:hypothetical protein